MTSEQYAELSLIVEDLKYLLETARAKDYLSRVARSELEIARSKITDILGDM